MSRVRSISGVLLAAGLALAAHAGAAPTDLLDSFEHELATHDSATAVLQAWCETRHLARPGTRIQAQPVKGANKLAPPEVLKALGGAAEGAVRYRRVDLKCGDRVLSQADNWYLPGKLTAEMNLVLDESGTPFGVAVKALNFHRKTLSSALRPAPDRVLQHSAVLLNGKGEPFSFVVETYTDQVLAVTASDRP